MKNGEVVREFEQKFAERVGAEYAIATANGTVSLEIALRAIGIQPGETIGTTPLTMASTSIAILNVGAIPKYRDVNRSTWLYDHTLPTSDTAKTSKARIVVALYGAHWADGGGTTIVDAAQTLQPHRVGSGFTSYSFQASKILATGEGGMLVTNSEDKAIAARRIASLGYPLGAQTSVIDANAIKRADYIRHVVYPSTNARMSDAQAVLGLAQLAKADSLIQSRRQAAILYDTATKGCTWLGKQMAVSGHDYWAYTLAVETPALARIVQDAMVVFGGEMPYGAWRLTFDEPAFEHLDPGPKFCTNARELQPRLLQFQTNNPESVVRNAAALASTVAVIDAARAGNVDPADAIDAMAPYVNKNVQGLLPSLLESAKQMGYLDDKTAAAMAAANKPTSGAIGPKRKPLTEKEAPAWRA